MRGCEHCEVGYECEREYVRKCECVGGGRVSVRECVRGCEREKVCEECMCKRA